MSDRREHPAPERLRARGIERAVEVAPGEGDFRIQNAGRQLGLLFREELMQRLAARAASNQGDVAV
jgi:rRNA maturation endonuclease Nob1